jgi:demethylmenaquinone methyltransferase / 2-methoxy-6-polyprenyl-1,4-benzoquinol methylase
MDKQEPSPDATHFGFQSVPVEQKEGKVAEVFHSVASNYDVMNDAMSLGLHRVWKQFTVGRANLRQGQKVLDVAGGTGDLSLAFAKKVGATGQVWLTDINRSMLSLGRDRLLDHGALQPAVQCSAEELPFPDAYFDVVTVAFGLRNMTNKERALAEMKRVLTPGGKLMVLEFSRIAAPLSKAYDWYSFNVLPKLGQWLTKDAHSYQYLAESIRMHPDQETLKGMMQGVGFARVQYFNMSAGIVALHEGINLPG